MQFLFLEILWTKGNFQKESFLFENCPYYDSACIKVPWKIPL